MSSYVSEEEQLERVKSFVKNYGNAVVSGVLVALIGFFGWQIWQKRQATSRYELASQYQQVIDASQRLQSNPDDQQLRTQYFTKADALIKANADSAQAIETEFLSAQLAATKGDYATAEKQLTAAANSKIKDAGLKQIALIRLAYIQQAAAKSDAALDTLKQVSDPAFAASANELKGDILVQKNDIAGARTAYQAAWDDLVKRQEPRQMLQVKLQSVGVNVADMNIPGPIHQAS